METGYLNKNFAEYWDDEANLNTFEFGCNKKEKKPNSFHVGELNLALIFMIVI